MKIENDASPELQVILDYFIKLSAPKVFNPHDERSVIINSEKEFEEMVIALEDNGAPLIRQATVFMFYSKIASLEKKASKMNNNGA